jgi:hypothetical protein
MRRLGNNPEMFDRLACCVALRPARLTQMAAFFASFGAMACAASSSGHQAGPIATGPDAGVGGTGGRAASGSGGGATAGATFGGGGMMDAVATDAMPGDAADAAADGDAKSPAVDFCSRLTNPNALAGEIAIEFDLVSAADCRVSWIPWLYVLEAGNERATFLNDLLRFNLSLWGCTTTRPTHFRLIYEPGLAEDRITRTDAEALIDDYLGAAAPLLDLGAGEIEALRRELLALSEPVVGPGTGYSRSKCAGADAAPPDGAVEAGGADASKPDVAGPTVIGVEAGGVP